MEKSRFVTGSPVCQADDLPVSHDAPCLSFFGMRGGLFLKTSWAILTSCQGHKISPPEKLGLFKKDILFMAGWWDVE